MGKKPRYFFQLFDPSEKVVDWTSARFYGTPEEAEADYWLLRAILENPDSLRLRCFLKDIEFVEPATGKKFWKKQPFWQAVAVEILAESLTGFAEEKDGWGLLCNAPDPCDPQKFRCKTTALRRFLELADAPENYFGWRDAASKRYCFSVAEPCFRLLKAAPAAHSMGLDAAGLIGFFQKKFTEYCATSAKKSAIQPTEYFWGKVEQRGDCWQVLFFGKIKDSSFGPCSCETPAKMEVETDVLLLESCCFPCELAAKTALDGICNLAVAQNNWLAELPDEAGNIGVFFSDPSKILAGSPQGYPDRRSLEAAIARAIACARNEGMHLVEHILLRPRLVEEGPCCTLPICPEPECAQCWVDETDDPCASPADGELHVPGADPYSFWATVALPGWSPRFRRADARAPFEEMLYREAPAHVALNLRWLTPHDFHKFEENYGRWLQWLAVHGDESQLCPPKMGENGPVTPLCALVDCLSKPPERAFCPENEAAPADCDCGDGPTAEAPRETRRSIFILKTECGTDIGPSGIPFCERPAPPKGDEVLVEIAIAASTDFSAPPARAAKLPTALIFKERQERHRKIYENWIEKAAVGQPELRGQADAFMAGAASHWAFSKLMNVLLPADLQEDAARNALVFEGLNALAWHFLDEQVKLKPAEAEAEAVGFLQKKLAEWSGLGLDGIGLAAGWAGHELQGLSAVTAWQTVLGAFSVKKPAKKAAPPAKKAAKNKK